AAVASARHPFDPILFAAVVALVTIGIVMTYSASAVYAAQKYQDSVYFLERDLVYTLLGGIGMWYGMKTDYSAWRRWAYPMLIIAIALLAAVLVFGTRMNGAARWFRAGPLSLQPAEPAKFALVVWLSYSLAKKAGEVKSFAIGFL